MAQKVEILFTDDLDGGEAEGTVSFGLDGATYEIDLSTANAAKLRTVLGPYVAAGRKVGGSARRAGQGRARRAGSGGVNPTEVREWAKANNVEVNDRGRVPASVIAQYREATGA
ncbi:MAG: Lsr2 family protein [Streptosporangiaceae bacterium]|nr:Lsr2 family protein [Streptosporangiaceae bacterium]